MAEAKNTFLPTWQQAKPFVYTGAGIAAVVAAFKFGPQLWNYIFPPNPAGDVNPNNLSFTQAQYKAMADRLEVAMRLFNTDEATVYSVLNQMITGDDLKSLINAFGIRNHGSLLWKNDWNLTQWMTNELDADELTTVQNRFNQLGVPF
jgi:hypothetical protein